MFRRFTNGLGLVVGLILILAANAAFIFYALPDSIVGRSVSRIWSTYTSDEPVEPAMLPRSFLCVEAIPEFTLTEQSNPNDQDLAKLCGCIWENLSEDDQRFAQELRAGNGPEQNAARAQLFAGAFGQGLQKCNAYEY